MISDGREAVNLVFDQSGVRAVPGGTSQHQVLGGEAIAQLLIGSDDPSEIAGAAAMTLTGDEPGLIDALFPAQQPTLSAWDQI